jgi:acyl-CoA synthetase (AMP-forming)/AMP-acid ligase II
MRLPHLLAAPETAYLSVGDMARRDLGGFYTLVDRNNNMIISGGENIYAPEVENIPGGHPQVHDVAVTGRSDAKSARSCTPSSSCATVRKQQKTRSWHGAQAGLPKPPKSVSFIADAQMPGVGNPKDPASHPHPPVTGYRQLVIVNDLATRSGFQIDNRSVADFLGRSCDINQVFERS